MIRNLYLLLSNKVFRAIFGPPAEDQPAYFLSGDIWNTELFTQLFALGLVVSVLHALFFHLYLNGKSMPAIFNSARYYWLTGLVCLIINGLAAYCYLYFSNLHRLNHNLCVIFSNLLIGFIAYIIISILTKRWSTSAKSVPF